MIKLGIIGTAGRPSKDPKIWIPMTCDLWYLMVELALEHAEKVGANQLISGGAAWADHTAIQLFVDHEKFDLHLDLPRGGKTEIVDRRYHGIFSKIIKLSYA